MQSTLHAARELAVRWRGANPQASSGGVVIVLDGLFVGHADALPPAEQWAPGCIAVAEDAGAHLARPAGFRGEVEWVDLGAPDAAPESPSEAEPSTDLEPESPTL